MSDFYVYVLFRHDTGQPFYVGKGRGDRWLRHDKDRPSDSNRHKRAVIKRAQDAGAEIPRIKIASGLSEPEAFEIEKLFISAIGRQHVGGPLTNLTDGGDGESGRIFSAEHRANMGAVRKGRKHSPEHCAKISATSRGRKHSEEAKQKISKGHQGRKRLRGWWSTDEGRRKQRENNRGHSGFNHSEASRAKIRATRAKQPPLSPDIRARIRDKIKEVWARRRDPCEMSTQA